VKRVAQNDIFLIVAAEGAGSVTLPLNSQVSLVGWEKDELIKSTQLKKLILFFVFSETLTF
jgi:hypothetical protein